MEWIAKGFYGEGGASGSSASAKKTADVAEVFSGGAVVSAEEIAYLQECIRNPQGPSPTILQGAALLQQLKRKPS